MRGWNGWSLAAVAVLLVGVALAPRGGFGAQDAPTPEPSEVAGAAPLREVLFQAALERLPEPPAFVRLLRIVLQPGASVPLHTHPGPEFGRIESGTLTILVEGEAVFAQKGTGETPPPVRIAPIGEAFSLVTGDQIVYPASVPLSFSNQGDEPTSILSAVVLPAGNQRPAGAEWIDGTPGPDAFAGVTSQVMGDAVAPGWPQGPLAVVLERLILDSGESLPPRAGPVMLAVEVGQFAFATVEGTVQVSRGSSGPQQNATPGASFALNPGDAVFFPGGMNAVPRPADGGVLVVLRLSVLPTAAAGADAPSPTAAPSVTAAAEAGSTFAVGSTAVVNASGVRLRDAPSIDGAVVAELAQGRELEVLGEPVAGSGFRWYEVRATDDDAVTGFIAEEFLAAA